MYIYTLESPKRTGDMFAYTKHAVQITQKAWLFVGRKTYAADSKPRKHCVTQHFLHVCRVGWTLSSQSGLI